MFVVSSHSLINDINQVKDSAYIFHLKWQNLTKMSSSLHHWILLFNISIVTQMSYIKCLATCILYHSLSLLERKHCFDFYEQ